LLAATITVPESVYDTPEATSTFFATLLDRLPPADRRAFLRALQTLDPASS